MRRSLPLFLLVALSMALVRPAAAAGGGTPATPPGAAASVPPPRDFNGDGFSDLAVGVPGDDTAESDAGAVNVIRGGPDGLTATGNQLWTLDTPGVPGRADPGDQMGSAVAAGDFNGDGFADLAAGSPLDDVGQVDQAGSVLVLYGSRHGLTANGDQLWTQDAPGVRGDAGRGNHFGAALTGGDFNADGFADLAVGAPRQQVGDAFAAGAVTVLFGSAAGLTAAGDQVLSQSTPGIESHVGTLELFGQALAAGDLGKSGADDLAIGVPLDEAGGNGDAGSVTVLYGTADGLRAASSQRWTQATAGVADEPETGDLFGWSLVAGDFGRAPQDDLAVGAPGEDASTIADAGAVAVLYGGAGGLSASGNQFRTQNSNHVHGDAEANDAFGSALAAGNFGRGDQADLAIGVPGEDLETTTDSGAVNVLYGSGSGLVPSGNQLWNRNADGLVGEAQGGEHFGAALVGGQFGASALADLAAGAPKHALSDGTAAGAVIMLFGRFDGLAVKGNELWTQDSNGIAGRPETGDRFGEALG
jgi:FG-GAP repeat